MITQEYLKSILHYNLETGIFTWINDNNSKKVKVGDVAGTLMNAGYIHIKINGKKYLAHRLIWFYMTGDWPKSEIDHIDLDRSNNKWINLREATKTQNKGNQRKHLNNTSGIKGVSWHKASNKWRAQIKNNNKTIELGYFDDIENAAKAYETAANKYFGEFSRID